VEDMSKIFKGLFAVIVCCAFFGCATLDRVSSDDPFSARLDTLNSKRVSSQSWMLVSVITLATGFIAGTTFTTLKSLGSIDSKAADPWIIASYSLTGLASGASLYFFLDYNHQMNDYLETLRLQTQYNNAIQWTNKQSGQ
jgi:hypothetical protein